MGVSILDIAFCLCCLPCDPLDDLQRFPPRDLCHEFFQQAAQEYRWLEAYQYSRPRHQLEWWHEWYQESVFSYRAWDLLDDCHRFSDRGTRIRAMQELRSHLGEHDFLEGLMPLPMVYWRYKRLDN